MDMVILINAQSRRGARAAPLLKRQLPGSARLVITDSLEHCRSCLAELAERPPALLVAGGGDGTITNVINVLRDMKAPLPPMAALPLGTGNACARVTGAHGMKDALRKLSRLGEGPLPFQRFRLVRVNGRVAPFAGTGFDAELVDDYRSTIALRKLGGVGPPLGVRGYFTALFTRTLPRHLIGEGPAHVKVTNLGAAVRTVDSTGRIVDVPDSGAGAVLYEGLAGVAGAATIPEWGYRFRAFPFAQSDPDRLSIRLYGARAFQAVRQMVNLWRGVTPIPLMNDFLVEKVRMDFDREVPLQIAGDLESTHRTLEFDLAPESIELLDWSRLPA